MVDHTTRQGLALAKHVHTRHHRLPAARDSSQLDVVNIRTQRNPDDLLTKPLPFNRIQELCKLVGVEYEQDSMTRKAPEFNGVPEPESAQNCSRCVQDAIAELDNVAEDSYKDPTVFIQCSVSDLSFVQVIAPKVEHDSILRVCVTSVSLTFYPNCKCTPAHVGRTPAHAVTSTVAQVSGKRVIIATFIQLRGSQRERTTELRG